MFDGANQANVQAAGLGKELAAAGRALVEQGLAEAVTGAYGRVLIASATAQSAAAAVETARADREMAANRRDAGRVTDADVLQLDVFLARMREQQVQAVSEERIARARLNQLIGEPLGTVFTLDFTPVAAAVDTTDAAVLETEALKNRPEVTVASLQQQLADAAVKAARASFLPQVAAQGGWEFNGGAWNSRASSWVVGAVARINLFHGFADQARLARSARAGHATRPRPRKGGDLRPARRADRAGPPRRGPRERSRGPRRRRPGAREPPHHPRPLRERTGRRHVAPPIGGSRAARRGTTNHRARERPHRHGGA